jgi:hypothetical protein
MAEKRNLYIVELAHDPGISPLGNGAYRPVARETRALLPKLLAERGIKSLGMYHLDPGHRALLILEARSVEEVRDALYQAKLLHWCTGQIYPATPLNQMKNIVGELGAAVTTTASPA